MEGGARVLTFPGDDSHSERSAKYRPVRRASSGATIAMNRTGGLMRCYWIERFISTKLSKSGVRQRVDSPHTRTSSEPMQCF